MRNGSLSSNVVFEKEVIFHEFDFEASELDFDVSKSSIWKHTTLCDRLGVFFLSLISRNLDGQLSSNFHRFVILCICWDTTSVKPGIWQLPKVSSAFNQACNFVLGIISTNIFIEYESRPTSTCSYDVGLNRLLMLFYQSFSDVLRLNKMVIVGC